jgi:hypothetical protein
VRSNSTEGSRLWRYIQCLRGTLQASLLTARYVFRTHHTVILAQEHDVIAIGQPVGIGQSKKLPARDQPPVLSALDTCMYWLGFSLLRHSDLSASPILSLHTYTARWGRSWRAWI